MDSCQAQKGISYDFGRKINEILPELEKEFYFEIKKVGTNPATYSFGPHIDSGKIIEEKPEEAKKEEKSEELSNKEIKERVDRLRKEALKRSEELKKKQGNY